VGILVVCPKCKVMGVLSVKSVTVETMCKNQTQRIIRLITTSTVNELENV
jgi:hypothetical protein